MENKAILSPPPPTGPKRTLLVVDGSYLMISARKMNLTIDYMKLVQELERSLGCEFYEKWFINGGEGPNASNNAFNNMLRAAPPTGPQFRVKILQMKTYTSYCKTCKHNVESRVQKGVDVSIATLILKHSFQNLCDQVVLIAGDGDFYEALSTAKDELRKDLILVGFQDFTLSLDLQQLANKVIWMNNLIDLIRDVPVQPVQAQTVPSHIHLLPHPVVMPQVHLQPTPLPQILRIPTHMAPYPLQPQTQLQSLQQSQPPYIQQSYQPQAQPQPQTQTQTQTQQQQPQPQQKSVNWNCSICTFANQGWSNFCEICSSPRPTSVPSPAPTPTPPPPSPTPSPTPISTTPIPSPAAVCPPPSVVATLVATPMNGVNYYGAPSIRNTPVAQVVPPAVASSPQSMSLSALPNKLPAVGVTPEGLYPCPLCTYHRKSNSSCEMCGYS